MEKHNIEKNSSVSDNLEEDFQEFKKVEEEIAHIDNTIGRHLGPIATTKPKNKWLAFLLCFFLGFLGIHKFYEGRIVWGFIYMFSGGIFGIGVLVDLIVILFLRGNPYYIEEKTDK